MLIFARCSHSSDSYVSRANPRDNTRHVILSTASMRSLDFAAQLNVSLANGWGIVRTVADLCLKMPEGKYVLVKDPNKVCIFFSWHRVLGRACGAFLVPTSDWPHLRCSFIFLRSRLFDCMPFPSLHSWAMKKRVRPLRKRQSPNNTCKCLRC